MNTAASLRRDLERSLDLDVLAQTIAVQRQQLKDQMHIADAARARIDGDADLDDVTIWARAAGNALDVATALNENLEMQHSMTRLADLPKEFTAGALLEAALKAHKTGDETFLPALAKLNAELAQAKPKGGARGRV